MLLAIDHKSTWHIQAKPVLQQTAYWAQVKQNQGYHTRAFSVQIESDGEWATRHANQHLHEDILVVLQPLSHNYQMAYVPYGPVFNPGDDYQGAFLEELSETLRPHLPDNCLFIRYDLNWESPWVHDENRYSGNQWLGAPEARIREMRMNFTTKNWQLRKSPSDNLPAHTVFLDVQQPPDDLLMRMKPKTRYNIRLSARRGVSVKEVNADNLAVWYQLYSDTAQRNGIQLHDISYFETVLQTRAQESRSPADIHMLLAEYDNQPLAGMILGITSTRATYLYGASGTAHRNKMPTYALQWEAIKKAAELGCREYDMFGISQLPDPAHPMYGLYRFKTGFGGNTFHRQGCWDYPYDESVYEVYITQEMNSQGYHIN